MPPFGLQRLLAVPPLFLLIGSLAHADAITGRVVDGNGVGVAGVDIDFVSLGSGGNPHEMNDGTDANGNFLTTLDPGVYEVRFFAPPPPATTLLTGVRTPVVVTGTVNLGTIILTSGVLLQGTAKNSANAPVGGIKVNAFHTTTGAAVLLKNNVTSAFGTFQVAVPATALRLDYTTNAVVGQTLVPKRSFVTVSGATNLGTVSFQNGFHVTGTAQTQTGVAVPGANLDVIDPLTNEKLYTPGDNTSSTGLFDVVLAAGTYDFELSRPAALALVGVLREAVAISTTTNLGTFTMRNGVFLTGTIRDRKGAPVQGADVNVHEVATGLPVALGSDNSNAAGFYSVVVPTGLLNVVFAPPTNRNQFNKDRHDGVNITANTVLDGRLPGAPRMSPNSEAPTLAPPILPFARGTAGTLGVPFIQGSLRGTRLTIHVLGGRPGARAALAFGLAQQGLANDAHLVNALARVQVDLDADGAARVEVPRAVLQNLKSPLFAQAWIRDSNAQSGIALSHILALSSN
jgi:hypothetical protein